MIGKHCVDKRRKAPRPGAGPFDGWSERLRKESGRMVKVERTGPQPLKSVVRIRLRRCGVAEQFFLDKSSKLAPLRSKQVSKLARRSSSHADTEAGIDYPAFL